MKIFLVVLILVALFFVFLTNTWATQKFQLKTQDISKFFLNKIILVRTCQGMMLISSPRAPDPIRLNSDLPRKSCHLVEYYDGGYHYWMCVEGAGSVRCPCEDIYIPQ